MLEAGRSYRFRVRPVNIEGVEGPTSESVVSFSLAAGGGGSRMWQFDFFKPGSDARKRYPSGMNGWHLSDANYRMAAKNAALVFLGGVAVGGPDCLDVSVSIQQPRKSQTVRKSFFRLQGWDGRIRGMLSIRVCGIHRDAGDRSANAPARRSTGGINCLSVACAVLRILFLSASTGPPL